jgi:pimeloyl-ACP methyl ester carboxylesterase
LLSNIAAGQGSSSLKQPGLQPTRSAISYRRSSDNETADLYQGGTPPRGGVVVVPGLTPSGKDDPRLVAFAQSLASAQFLVLVPDIADTRALKVSAAGSAFVADAIGALARRLDPAGRRRVGLVAISYAVGPALLAVAQTPAGSHVGFVVAIGGYYDIAAAIGFVTTGYNRLPDGEWRYQEPNDFGKWVFLRSNADGVSDPADRDRLRKIAQHRLASPMAAIDDLLAGLGPEGRAVYALITNRDPGQVPALTARLPLAIREDLRRLNLKEQNLGAIHGPVFIIHGRDDTTIPYTQSEELAAALGSRAHLYVIDYFAHVGAAGTSLSDNLQLLSAATDILKERDRSTAEWSP